MSYCFLCTIRYFNLETALIVGNNEVEKLNPATIGLLRKAHYRVYLISVLTESILDLMQLIYLEEIKEHYESKGGKWNNILNELKRKNHNVDEILLPNEQKKLLCFSKKYRNNELHNFSQVGSFISKNEWDHLQEEEIIISNALSKLYSKFT